ncbi:T9SS type A sorting domain-containing protein [Cytophagaceae bacterium YF14B1]|uniref:T9SS type A sorting domain-containing protein n=1 Tax=Xanthocytophaga flava TaxID=3048013 RepID=A0AAE3QZ22_9BACT|nr:T9SS type A sorting domain-containing protein [Xanthocytophaga flavus]MDJ1485138.1 T9SS type A sorting domain-containing protein [Xanthocytophaga flavus]
MVKNYFLSGIFLLFSYCSLTAQTGPGGVGQTGSSGNIGLWLRADNIFNTTNGTTISSWPDASGRNNSAVQGTTTNRPTYISNSNFNSRPAIRFDGVNDVMTIPTPGAATHILNGYTGSSYDALTYFVVLRPRNISALNPRGILSKRNTNTGTINSDYAYDMYLQDPFFFTDPYGLFVGVANNGNREEFNNNRSYSDNNNYIVGFRFDGSQGGNDNNNDRGGIYEGRYNPVFPTIDFTNLNNSTAPLTIGALAANNNSYSDMDIAEIIQLNRSLNEAERIILENYLSSKYNINIDNNDDDYFAYDNPGNNYYGNDVAGIGRTAFGSQQNSAKGTGIVQISNPSDLENNEFLLWGHNGVALNILSSDVPIAIFGSGQRLGRVWRASETGNVGTMTITFDVSGIPTITANNYRNLRIFTDTDGNFNNATTSGEPSQTQSNFSGANRLVTFTGINFSNGSYFSLGTSNSSATPLPVTFISFDATNQAGKVSLKWYTASEENNSFFTVERSHNGQDWETVTTVNGAGTTNQALGYTAYDNNPYQGTSYYRIKQTDYNAEFSYSRIATVTVLGANSEVTLSPNPVKDDILRLTFAEGLQINQVVITNTLGQEVYRKNVSQVQELEINTQGYPTGAYFVIISGNNYHKTSKILVER